ncbi:MAG TPA: NUDIX domain-containing protein [Devosiaceae bacterium]|nr:NUDIX domain-containing protein [Devosiaceae bacterium]
MNAEVEIVAVDTLSRNWGVLQKYTFDINSLNGERQRHEREVYDRGDAAVVLLHNPVRDTVILTRQFRLPAHLSDGNGFLIEACAGLLDGEDPETCARREAEEETGYRVGGLRHVFSAFMSPGSVTEKLHFFIGSYDAAAKVAAGGGLDHEGEDIEVMEMSLGTALAMIGSGEIVDAKTIMLLQVLALAERQG